MDLTWPKSRRLYLSGATELMAPCHLQSQRPIRRVLFALHHSSIDSDTASSLFPHLKDPWDYIGPRWVIQANFFISHSQMISNFSSICYLIPLPFAKSQNVSQVPGIRTPDIFGDHPPASHRDFELFGKVGKPMQKPAVQLPQTVWGGWRARCLRRGRCS